MGRLTGLMKAVKVIVYESKHVDSAAGRRLFESSVTLRLCTDEVLGLIKEVGIDAVAKQFRIMENRPVLEHDALEALEQGANSRDKFVEWAHQLWNLIDTFQLTGTANIENIFMHEKGYSRACKFVVNEFADQPFGEYGRSTLDIAMILGKVWTVKNMQAPPSFGEWQKILADLKSHIRRYLGDKLFAEFSEISSESLHAVLLENDLTVDDGNASDLT